MGARKTWETSLKTGQKAPQFTAILDDGSEITSKDLLGKRVVLFFYNHDGTPTCTVEACNIRDNYARLRKSGLEVYGISEDSVRKHQNFRKKYDLPYPLIADEGNALARKFDIYGLKKFMGREFEAAHRTTFVIGPAWKIEQIIHPVESKVHATQILEGLKKA